ncbi:hypothetical protein E2C01_078873 [Portunus trituberculatus]|uniref:Uncharacterized protein n=1 Tax=Portunus trituberculatus TaxID=210409 RepID=A0A5B7INV2_PORTR|nr:hypothetical protein [Portunus trituberculatus]
MVLAGENTMKTGTKAHSIRQHHRHTETTALHHQKHVSFIAQHTASRNKGSQHHTAPQTYRHTNQHITLLEPRVFHSTAPQSTTDTNHPTASPEPRVFHSTAHSVTEQRITTSHSTTQTHKPPQHNQNHVSFIAQQTASTQQHRHKPTRRINRTTDLMTSLPRDTPQCSSVTYVSALQHTHPLSTNHQPPLLITHWGKREVERQRDREAQEHKREGNWSLGRERSREAERQRREGNWSLGGERSREAEKQRGRKAEQHRREGESRTDTHTFILLSFYQSFVSPSCMMKTA